MLSFAHGLQQTPAMKRPRRPAAMAAVLLALAALGLSVVMGDGGAPPASGGETEKFPRAELRIATAAGDELRFDVEVARTSAQRAQGLMFRTALAPDAGMLFIYDPPREMAMWMRNTILSLDMLFIAADGRITRIVANTTPMSEATIESRGPVGAVLELVAGSAKRLGIRSGDRIDLTPFAP